MEGLLSWFPNGMSHYVVGGVFIGVAVSLLYVTTGLIGGMSTVYSSVWSYVSPHFQQASLVGSRGWRLVYAGGLIIGAAIWVLGMGHTVPTTEVPWPQLAIGGFIAGFGARLGNGCTSGHGICGMASLNGLSIVAVVVFLTAAIVTAQLMQAWGA